MSIARREYFADVLSDALQVCKEMNIDPAAHALVAAALIQSDALNGLRKAIVSPAFQSASRSRNAPTDGY
jgi:hypothetical protein